MIKDLLKTFNKKSVAQDHQESGFGFYGKVPAIGDFFSRNLSQASIQVIDQWLQEGLVFIRQTDDDWLDSYLTAPVWQFVLPAGTIAEHAFAGVLMASVDSIGRYFPLVAVHSLASHQQTNPDLTQLPYQLAWLSDYLPTAVQHKLLPDLILEQTNDLSATALSQELTIDPELIQPTVTESLWWACDQQGQQTCFQHSTGLDIALFSKLFLNKSPHC